MKAEQTINGLPEGWKQMKLGDAVQVLDNLRKPVNASERQTRIANKPEKELIPYYGATGQVGWIDDFITEGEFVLVGEDGAPFLDNFKEKAYKINGRTWVNNHAHILQGKDGVTLNDFILHFLNSINYREHVNGTTRLKLTKSSLTEIPFPVPPIKVQQQIVSKIEELFSELDKGIEELKTAQQQLKVYRQAVLKWAFEGRLTNEAVQDGKLPEGWRWKTINELVEKVFDGPFGSHLKSSDYVTHGIRVIRLENIGVLDFKDEYKTFISEEKFEKIKKHTVTKGDIIFSSFIMGETRVVVLPNYIQAAINKADCFCLRPDEREIDKNFLAYFLSTKNVYNQLVQEVHGATRPRINTKQLKACLVPHCSLDEQEKIVQEIESRLSVCDKMEQTLIDSLKKTEALRQSILKKMLKAE